MDRVHDTRRRRLNLGAPAPQPDVLPARGRGLGRGRPAAVPYMESAAPVQPDQAAQLAALLRRFDAQEQELQELRARLAQAQDQPPQAQPNAPQGVLVDVPVAQQNGQVAAPISISLF